MSVHAYNAKGRNCIGIWVTLCRLKPVFINDSSLLRNAMTKYPRLRSSIALSVILSVAGLAPAAHAQEVGVPSYGVYVQASHGSNDFGNTKFGTVGLMAPFMSPYAFAGGSVTGYWDLYLSRVETPTAAGGRQRFEQLGLTPTFRYRPDAGASRFFIDGGIGISYFDADYYVRRQEFSTRFNFASHIGVGVSLGQQREHEIVLRAQHISNAGIDKPNPGDNLIQLRYAYRF